MRTIVRETVLTLDFVFFSLLVNKADITSGLQLGKAEVLRGLMTF